MRRITPFLWFDGRAEEAARFYVAIFEHSKITSVSRYPENAPGAEGTAMTVEFELDGQAFVALNGGPEYTFTPAVSFSIECATQAEVDHFWDRLCEGGKPIQCGGSRTSSGCRGKSYRRSCRSCYRTTTRTKRAPSCRRCSRWSSSTSRPCKPHTTTREIHDGCGLFCYCFQRTWPKSRLTETASE